MNRTEYIEQHRRLFDQYIIDVREGNIVTSKYIKQAVRRHVSDLERDDLEFREDKIERVLEFFSFLNINIRNKYSQFILSGYQVFILLSLFGWYWKGTDKRRFRYAFLYTARKTGKTVFSVAIQLYGLMYDRELNAQSLLLANSREQAGTALDYAKDIIANSPALRKRLEVQQYKIKYKYKNTTCLMKTLASQAHRLDSYNPSMVLIDEFHAYPTDDLLKVMKSGMMARNNPLLIITTTAGFDSSLPCYDVIELCKAILTGQVQDDSYFVALYTLDPEDDYKDPVHWIKSNPNIGVTVSLDSLTIEYNQAKNRPSELRNFLTKNLNVYVDSVDAWIEDYALDLCKALLKESDFEGMDCHIGIDLSATTDLTSIVTVFESEGKFYSLPYFFCTDRTNRARKGGIDLTHWIETGRIIKSNSKTIDYQLVFELIERLSKIFNIVSVTYDPWNSHLIIPRLQSELDLFCDPMAQNATEFNFPLKYLEKLIYEESIILSDNPVLFWNIKNVVLYQDGNGNIKIVKNRSKDSVDGAVSLAEALRGWIKYNFNSETIAIQHLNAQAS